MKGSLQIKSGKYYAVFRFNGKLKWVNLHIESKGNNKRKAENALREVLVKYGENDYIASDILFVDFLDMWLERIKALVKPSTWESYVKITNGKIKPYFESKKYKLKDLKGMYFTDYFTYLRDYGRSDGRGGLVKKAVLNVRCVLSSAFKYALENDLIEYNYIERSRLPLFDEHRFTPTVYTAEQIRTLLDFAEKTSSAVSLFLFLEMFTGARKGEILGLTWNNVNFEDNTIHICKNRTGSKKEVLDVLTSPKTKNGIRTIVLPAKVMDMLKAEKELQKQNKKLLKGYYVNYNYDYVIRKADGSIYNPNSINRIIRRLETAANLPHCRVHDFRHAVASLLFEQGAELKDVSTQLGHGQTSTTEKIYIHRKNSSNVQNMQFLSDAIGI